MNVSEAIREARRRVSPVYNNGDQRWAFTSVRDGHIRVHVFPTRKQARRIREMEIASQTLALVGINSRDRANLIYATAIRQQEPFASIIGLARRVVHSACLLHILTEFYVCRALGMEPYKIPIAFRLSMFPIDAPTVFLPTN